MHVARQLQKLNPADLGIAYWKTEKLARKLFSCVRNLFTPAAGAYQRL